ncbi:MAG: extracellular solute-binding protein [Candidatus Parvarchaeota archaeon]
MPAQKVVVAILIVLVIIFAVSTGYLLVFPPAPLKKTVTVTQSVTVTRTVTSTVTIMTTGTLITTAPPTTVVVTPTVRPTVPVAKEIHQWDGLTGGDGVVFDEIVWKFGNATGIKIVRTTLFWNDLYARVSSTYKAGGELPPVLLMHTSEVPLYAGTVFVPIDDLVKELGISKDMFLETAWEGCIWNGKLYCLPWDVHLFAVFFRIDLAQQYDIPVPPPACKTYGLKCWDKPIRDRNDYLEWLRLAKSKLPPDIAPAGWTPGDLNNFWAYWGFLESNPFVGTGTEQDPKPDFKSQDSVEVFRLHQKMYEEGLGTVVTWNDLASCLCNGKVFTWYNGPWMQTTFDRLEACPYGVIPVFSKVGTWGNSHIIALTETAFKDPATLEAVKLYLKHLYTAESNGYWGMHAGHVPTFKEALEPYKSFSFHRAMFAAQAFDFGFRYLPRHALIVQVADIVANALGLLLAGQTTAEEAATSVQDQVIEALEAFKAAAS